MALLIFDLDGTLLDSRESILESIAFALREIGRNFAVDERHAIRQDLLTTLRDAEAKYSISLSEEEKRTFIKSYREHNTSRAVEMIRPYKNVPEVLSQLKKNFSLAVATTKNSHQATQILKQLKMDHFFDVIQGTDSGLRYKPAPDILIRVSELLGISSEKAIYVGDSPHDIQAAQAGAMLSVGVNYGYSTFDEIQQANPLFVLNEFNDLIGLQETFLKEIRCRSIPGGGLGAS